MKVRYLIFAVSLILLASSCTSTKNTGGTRWYHSFNTRYNVYFNGDEAFKEAYKTQLDNYSENYSEMILMYPVSALPKEKSKPGGSFDKSIEKAVKAIKMHSIQTKPQRKQGKGNDPKYKEFMSRTEFNPFLHNAWMLMAKSQFYNGDFLEAASSFSYISRLYESQPEIATPAKIWKARCYSEMGWYYDADNILSKINTNQLPKNQSDWFSTVYADYLIKQKQYAEAVPYLKTAIKSEKNKYQRNREKYLLGQIYTTTGQNDLAYKTFGEVASSTVPYILQLSAGIRQTEVYPGGDIKKISNKLEGMTKSPKNKDYLDQVYYALGNVYMTVPDTAKAIENYELGVKKSKLNGIAKAMNQIKLGDIYFNLREYVKAQPNYSDALSQLKKEDEDFPRVSKRSEVLDALVTHYEAVQLQDSLLRLSQMTDEERMVVVKKIIADLIKKEAEEKKKAEMDEYLAQQENLQAERRATSGIKQPVQPIASTPASAQQSFYFYNQQAVALGKNAFQQKWGRRKLEDDWRRRDKTSSLLDATQNGDLAMANDSIQPSDSTSLVDSTKVTASKKENVELSSDPKDPQYYLQQIPETEEDIAAANLIIADGLYNMAVIYKDMLEDDNLALETFDELNTRYPDNENKLDAYHHIYLIYWKRGDMAMANLYKTKIRAEFPKSDLALAMADPNYEYNEKMMNVIQDSLYQNVYNNYLVGNPMAIRKIYNEVSTKYNQSKLMPKFMFLNALSYVQTNEADTFKVLLKQLIEKYPTEDVSVLAGDIMKGFQKGLLLGTGDNSLARSGLFNMRFSLAGGAVADSALVFTDSINTPYKLLLIYPKGSVNENMLLFTVASFNFGNFMVNDFDLQKTEINDEVGMLEINGFNNLSEVMQYFKMINQPSGYAQGLNQAVITVPISVDNYTTLIKGKSLNDYMLFFEKHFGEGNESLIEKWKVEKEDDKAKVEEKAKEEKKEAQQPAPATEEPEKEEPTVATPVDSVPATPIDSTSAVVTDSVKTQENTPDKYDEAIENVYNQATEKVENLEKTYNEIASDPIRGVMNLFKKKGTPSNAIDEYAKQKEKEEKELAKQQKKEQAAKDKVDRELAKQKDIEQKDLLKKQQAETDSVLKAQKKQEEDIAKLKVNEKKQQVADKKSAVKAKEDARKSSAKLKKEQLKEKEKQRKLDREEKTKKLKEQQKIKEKERKEKEIARKEAVKVKEKARAEAQKQKEAERKAKKK